MESTSNINANLTDNLSEVVNITAFLPAIGPEYIAAYNIYLYLMIILGVLGNLIVSLVFMQTPPSNTTDWFILAITVCDFISSFLSVPIYATFTNGYWRVFGTSFLCRLHMFISQSIVLSSSFLICGLALDRYLKICRQLSSFTKNRARNVCVLITFLTTVLSLPSLFMYENRAGRCVARVMNTSIFAYYLFVFIIFLFVTIVVVYSYFNVTKTVIESETNVARHKQLRTSNKNVWFSCFAYNRKNRVVPSISTVSHNGLFRDTMISTSLDANHGNSDNDNRHLKVPKTLYISTKQISTEFSQSPEAISPYQGTPSRKSHSQLKQLKSSSLRTTKISFLVCSIFILSWIPPWLSFVLASIPGLKANINAIRFMMFGRMTYLINGFSNPIIYALFNKKFRSQIIEILCCRKMKCCKSRVNHLF